MCNCLLFHKVKIYKSERIFFFFLPLSKTTFSLVHRVQHTLFIEMDSNVDNQDTADLI